MKEKITSTGKEKKETKDTVDFYDWFDSLEFKIKSTDKKALANGSGK